MAENASAAGGIVVEERPIVTFLYLLLRDEVTAGRIDAIVEQVREMPIGVLHRYRNDHLARYAAELADKLGCGQPPLTVRRAPVAELEQ